MSGLGRTARKKGITTITGSQSRSAEGIDPIVQSHLAFFGVTAFGLGQQQGLEALDSTPQHGMGQGTLVIGAAFRLGEAIPIGRDPMRTTIEISHRRIIALGMGF